MVDLNRRGFMGIAHHDMDRLRSLLTQSTSPVSITTKMEHRADPSMDYVEPVDSRREQERSDYRSVHQVLDEDGILFSDHFELLSRNRDRSFDFADKGTVTNSNAVEQALFSGDVEAKFGDYLRMGESWKGISIQDEALFAKSWIFQSLMFGIK